VLCKSSMFMMSSLACGLLKVLVFYPSRCELTIVKLMLWFEQGWNSRDGGNPSGNVVCHAQIC
jgi:hypothetical protein